ncbi:helix-turn-helix domain-containing protein [Bradyrhizobium sp. 150]|uniref:helix-turn-helix domain-containing protein n=1 Tax=Bradyrhizobium sp. 150 TaxID=2782625 RepID=UPI001FFBEB77|nr:helix-turn-helix domain-containing protein [Bradyrhizobium sp. 150]MCK1677485.1 helix-turn-helix domain-containing protein [Bradyrhizobium sp. 150]
MDVADLPAFLTADEVAALLRVSRETIRRRARRGELQYVNGLGVFRFPREAVLSLYYCGAPPEGPR